MVQHSVSWLAVNKIKTEEMGNHCDEITSMLYLSFVGDAMGSVFHKSEVLFNCSLTTCSHKVTEMSNVFCHLQWHPILWGPLWPPCWTSGMHYGKVWSVQGILITAVWLINAFTAATCTLNTQIWPLHSILTCLSSNASSLAFWLSKILRNWKSK